MYIIVYFNIIAIIYILICNICVSCILSKIIWKLSKNYSNKKKICKCFLKKVSPGQSDRSMGRTSDTRCSERFLSPDWPASTCFSLQRVTCGWWARLCLLLYAATDLDRSHFKHENIHECTEVLQWIPLDIELVCVCVCVSLQKGNNSKGLQELINWDSSPLRMIDRRFLLK